jgi:endoglucanase
MVALGATCVVALGAACVVALLAFASASAAPASASASPASDLRVRGNRLIDGPGAGHVVVLRGVNRSGLEYSCIQGSGFFDSPHPDQIDDPPMIAAMVNWDINAVRVPLNEDCWLGVNAPPQFSGAAYRRIVERYVRAVQAARLYVILDLHMVAPGTQPATAQLPMADQDHAPAFWRSVATAFKGDGGVIFDLFNEPYGISWGCWRSGCEIPPEAGVPAYQAAGMQELVDAVRATGAAQPLLLGGPEYASDVSQWAAYAPHDPRNALIAAQHDYGGLSPCNPAAGPRLRA